MIRCRLCLGKKIGLAMALEVDSSEDDDDEEESESLPELDDDEEDDDGGDLARRLAGAIMDVCGFLGLEVVGGTITSLMESFGLSIPFITSMRSHILFVHLMDGFPLLEDTADHQRTKNAVFPFYRLKNCVYITYRM